VIERFINIEWIINAIICQHYFKRVIKPFILEVLYDEYFSFALKRRILEKIVEDLESRKLQDLNRANTIRNYFAHCNQQIVEGSDLTADGKAIDPKKIDKAIDFENLYHEFMAIAGGVEEYLMSIYQQKGGVFVKV
jgi:hypothetical protein